MVSSIPCRFRRLIGLACLASVLAGCGSEKPDLPPLPEETKARIKAIGASARYDDSGNVIAVDFLGRPIREDSFEEVAKFATVVDLHIQEIESLTDGSKLKPLAGLNQLEKFSITLVPVGNELFEAVSGISSLRELRVTNTKITGEGIEQLAALENLELLELKGWSITGEASVGLAELAQLKSLSVHSGPNQNKDFAGFLASELPDLGSMTSLESLSLIGSPVDDACLAKVSTIPSLKTLDCAGLEITDAGVESVGQMTTLTNLTLTATKATDAGFSHLGNLTNIRNLKLNNNSELTAAGLGGLAQMEALEELEFSDCAKIDDSVFDHLVNLPNLRSITMIQTAVNGSGFEALIAVKSLESLELDKAQLSDEGRAAVKKFEAARPEVFISYADEIVM